MSRRTLHEGEFLTLLRDRHWEYVRRRKASGAAFVIALTDSRELLLVEQWRIPVQCRVIELPAGIIGDGAYGDESVESSALRELEEETGFRGSTARVLCSGPVAVGMSSEIGHFVHVTGLVQVSDGGGVDDEDIRVHRVPLAQVDRWLDAQRLMVDPRVYIALHFLRS